MTKGTFVAPVCFLKNQAYTFRPSETMNSTKPSEIHAFMEKLYVVEYAAEALVPVLLYLRERERERERESECGAGARVPTYPHLYSNSSIVSVT